MKKIFFALVFFTFLIGCFFTLTWHTIQRNSGNNVSISINESEDRYKLYASYNKRKTRKIQRYLDSELNSHLFSSARINATVTLDDQTNFYIKANPGILLIKLNKSENSLESYYRIKELGEGIKRKLAEN